MDRTSQNTNHSRKGKAKRPPALANPVIVTESAPVSASLNGSPSSPENFESPSSLSSEIPSTPSEAERHAMSQSKPNPSVKSRLKDMYIMKRESTIDPEYLKMKQITTPRVKVQSTSTKEAPRTSEVAMVSKGQMSKPYHLSFYESDLESEYLQFSHKENSPRWKHTIMGLNTLLTVYYLYLVVNDIVIPEQTSRVFLSGLDVMLWVLSVPMPIITIAIVSQRQKSTPSHARMDLIHGCYVAVASVLGMSARYFVADFVVYTSGIRFSEGLFLENMFIVISFHLLRVRFFYTTVSVAIIVVSQMAFAVARLSRVTYSSYPANFTVIISAFTTLIAGVFAILLAYENEFHSRTQFLLSKEMKKATTKLQNQLKMLSKSFNKTAGTFDSPLERTVLIIRSVMADPSLSSQHLMSLGQVLSLLNSTNLLAPDLEAYLGDDVDNEQQAWLFSEFATNRKNGPGSHRKSVAPSGINPNLLDTSQDKGSFGRDSDRKTSLISREAPETSYPPVISQIATLLGQIHDYSFPIFDFAEATKNNPLLVASQHFFVNSNLLQAFSIPPEKLRNFLVTIESGYHKDLPYHNAVHATDVLHGVAYMSSQSSIRRFVNDIELLSLYVAAIIHDHDHPGVTNNFLVNTQDYKALLYNDRSVLENHHVATSFQILQQSDKNFLSHLPKADLKAIRENVIELVLATDLTQHFSLLSLFKTKVSSTENYDPSATREDRMLAYKIVIKCSDVSNPTKDLPQYERWCALILSEFLLQGDMEKSLQIPISPFMDRDNLNVPSMQLGFIDYVVLPLYEALDKFQPIPNIISRLQKNREHWANLKARNITTLTAPEGDTSRRASKDLSKEAKEHGNSKTGGSRSTSLQKLSNIANSDGEQKKA